MNFDIPSYIVGFLSALVILTIGHFLTKSRTNESAERERVHNAYDKFRSSIAQEIALWAACINNDVIISTGDNPASRLKKSSITAAIIEFRPFITKDTGDYDRIYTTYEYHKRNNSYNLNFECHRRGTELLKQLLKFAEQ